MNILCVLGLHRWKRTGAEKTGLYDGEVVIMIQWACVRSCRTIAFFPWRDPPRPTVKSDVEPH